MDEEVSGEKDGEDVVESSKEGDAASASPALKRAKKEDERSASPGRGAKKESKKKKASVGKKTAEVDEKASAGGAAASSSQQLPPAIVVPEGEEGPFVRLRVFFSSTDWEIDQDIDEACVGFSSYSGAQGGSMLSRALAAAIGSTNRKKICIAPLKLVAEFGTGAATGDFLEYVSEPISIWKFIEKGKQTLQKGSVEFTYSYYTRRREKENGKHQALKREALCFNDSWDDPYHRCRVFTWELLAHDHVVDFVDGAILPRFPKDVDLRYNNEEYAGIFGNGVMIDREQGSCTNVFVSTSKYFIFCEEGN